LAARDEQSVVVQEGLIEEAVVEGEVPAKVAGVFEETGAVKEAAVIEVAKSGLNR
jgi:hypothetical protein